MIKDNVIGDEGAKTMAEMLKVNTTLTSLNLNGKGERKGKERKGKERKGKKKK